MNVETVSSSSDSDVRSSILQDTALQQNDPPEASADGAIAEIVPPDITCSDDEVDVNSANSTITGPPTSHFRNQPMDDEIAQVAAADEKKYHSDSSSLPENPGTQESEMTDEEEMKDQFKSLWGPESATSASASSDQNSSAERSSVMRRSIFDDPETPLPNTKKKSVKPPSQPTPAQRRKIRTGNVDEDSDATPIMQSPMRPVKPSVRLARPTTQETPRQHKAPSTTQPKEQTMQSSDAKGSMKRTPKTSNDRKSSAKKEGIKSPKAKSQTTKPTPSLVPSKPPKPDSVPRQEKSSRSGEQQIPSKAAVLASKKSASASLPSQNKSLQSPHQSNPKTTTTASKAKTPGSKPTISEAQPRSSSAAPAKKPSLRSPQGRTKSKSSNPASALLTPTKDTGISSPKQQQRSITPKEKRDPSTTKPKSPTSVVKVPGSLADDSWSSSAGQTSNSESRRKSRLRSSSRDESKCSEMDSSQLTPSISISMRPSSFSQIPISAEMTPEEWKIAEHQIQFLENELDKVTALCLELTQSVEEEEKTERDRPSGDWLRARQQVRYLEQELETVSELCDLLTNTAKESTDAIETLEDEKAKLESLIRRLEKALDEKEAMMKKRDLVEEKESQCCGFCCNWIPEPIVWFVSYVYRVD